MVYCSILKQSYSISRSEVIMKKIIFIILSFALFSTVSYATRIIITGQPVVLEKQGDVYYVPHDYKTTTSYYYVSLNGTRQVCYLDKQPDLTSLNTSTLQVNYNGSTLSWVCYPLDPNYFEAQ